MLFWGPNVYTCLPQNGFPAKTKALFLTIRSKKNRMRLQFYQSRRHLTDQHEMGLKLDVTGCELKHV